MRSWLLRGTGRGPAEPDVAVVEGPTLEEGEEVQAVEVVLIQTGPIDVEQIRLAYERLEQRGTAADEFNVGKPTQAQKDEMLRRLGMDPDVRPFFAQAAQSVTLNAAGHLAVLNGAPLALPALEFLKDLIATQLMNGVMVGTLVDDEDEVGS